MEAENLANFERASMIVSNNTNGPVLLASLELGYTFPFGPMYLAGYMREHGEPVEMILFSEVKKGPRIEAAIRDIIEKKPLLLGLSGLFPHLKLAREIVKKLDQAGRKFPIVIGGQMVSPIPELSLAVVGADVGAIGEGELILHELVLALREGKDPIEVKGLILKDGDGFIHTGPGAFIHDLDELPKIPYDLLPKEEWLEIGRAYLRVRESLWPYGDRVGPIHGGRGCPYRCNFCYHHSLSRYRSTAKMMEDAQDLINRYNANVLYFGDDLVIPSSMRAGELVEGILSLTKPVAYSISSRFDILDRIDDNVLNELKRSGCRLMGLGIESGSQRILNIMNKKITVEQVHRGLSRLKKVGIIPTVSLMVGQLDETKEDVEASIALLRGTIRENRFLNYANFSIATPYPGSPLYDVCKERGYIKDDQDFFNKYQGSMNLLSVNMSRMTSEEVVGYRDLMSKVYQEERINAIGKSRYGLAMRIADWQIRLDNFFIGYKKSPKVERLESFHLLGFLTKIFELIYDQIEYCFGRMRTKLLGL